MSRTYDPAPEGQYRIVPGRSVVSSDDGGCYDVTSVAEDGMSGDATGIYTKVRVGFQITGRVVTRGQVRVRIAEYRTGTATSGGVSSIVDMLPDFAGQGFPGRVGVAETLASIHQKGWL